MSIKFSPYVSCLRPRVCGFESAGLARPEGLVYDPASKLAWEGSATKSAVQFSLARGLSEVRRSNGDIGEDREVTNGTTPRIGNTRRIASSTKQRRVQAQFLKTLGNCSKLTPQIVTAITNEVAEGLSFDILPEEGQDEGCSRRRMLVKKARSVVVFLSKELQIKPERVLPPEIECGTLRHIVRSIFPSGLSNQAELSFKSVQKLEHSVCKWCEERLQLRLDVWKQGCFEQVEVDSDHLHIFKKALRSNVPLGWNKKKYPYIPNGHASLHAKRREGGNWNADSFEDWCRPEVVISSGKPRVVTLFSEFNTRVLTPLHKSLYSHLRKRGWLLVGNPTDELVSSLNGFDYVSFDYRSATDRIKNAYVKAAVEVIIEQGEGLTDDEVRCLRVLANLRIEPDGDVATRGQPMGSVMSFPLLCLINKTVVDLSLNDLLETGKIQFDEWTGHRCLINGDDLLAREPRNESLLRPLIRKHGCKIGLEVNEEKTMVSKHEGEINSTLFVDGSVQRKVNAGALFMRPDVSDVLGFAAEATLSPAGFRRVVRANAHVLAKQEIKVHGYLPDPLREVCLKDAKIRRALSSVPLSRREPPRNLFNVETRPLGYDLDRSEEVRIVNERVSQLRSMTDCWRTERKQFRTKVAIGQRSPASALRYKKPAREEDTILSVLARAWERKLKESLREEECTYITFDHVFVEDISRVESLSNEIKKWKGSRGPSHASCVFDGFVGNDNEIKLCDGLETDVVPLG